MELASRDGQSLDAFLTSEICRANLDKYLARMGIVHVQVRSSGLANNLLARSLFLQVLIVGGMNDCLICACKPVTDTKEMLVAVAYN